MKKMADSRQEEASAVNRAMLRASCSLGSSHGFETPNKFCIYGGPRCTNFQARVKISNTISISSYLEVLRVESAANATAFATQPASSPPSPPSPPLPPPSPPPHPPLVIISLGCRAKCKNLVLLGR